MTRLTLQLPRPDDAPDGRPYLDVRDASSASVARLRKTGLAGHESPATAAILATCAMQGARASVVEVASGIGLHGLLCASMLRPRRVAILPGSPPAATAIEKIIERNQLAVIVDPGPRSAVAIDQVVEATGIQPTLLIVDSDSSPVRTLRRARRTIEHFRPVIFVEAPSSTRLVRIPPPFLAAMGYEGYRLSGRPGWRPRTQLKVAAGSEHRFVMLCVGGLAPGFVDRFDAWREELAVFDADRIALEHSPRGLLDWARAHGFVDLASSGRRWIRDRLAIR